VTTRQTLERPIAAAALVFLVLWPVFFGHGYWTSYIFTQTFVFGIAAASLIFLSAYGGMVSLAQVALYGISGYVLGNVVVQGEAKGLHLGWNPWLGVVLAIVITTAVAAVLGAVASRSAGIYFLMITLTYGVIAFSFFLSVTIFGGFSGVAGMDSFTPGLIGHPTEDPARLYYVALAISILVYVLFRFVLRTPFGLALQGIRDEPVRMTSLGYNVPLHRTLAFTLAGFVASLAGVLYSWSIGAVAPDTINISSTVDLLIVAVIGGLARLEGAWVGAFAFVVINNYVRDVSLPVVGGSFPTIIGLIFLAIIIVSPDGLMGGWDRVTRLFLGMRGGGSAPPPVDMQTAVPGAGS
jgi:branched-chain amino acid transport system permease protein